MWTLIVNELPRLVVSCVAAAQRAQSESELHWPNPTACKSGQAENDCVLTSAIVARRRMCTGRFWT